MSYLNIARALERSECITVNSGEFFSVHVTRLQGTLQVVTVKSVVGNCLAFVSLSRVSSIVGSNKQSLVTLFSL